jgi:mRNA interferase HicA
VLAQKGCTFGTHRGGSGHLAVIRGNRKSQLPMHGQKELGTGLVNKILRDLNGTSGRERLLESAGKSICRFSRRRQPRETLAGLRLAGLAKLVTETLRERRAGR